jgi:hypothetical protein
LSDHADHPDPGGAQNKRTSLRAVEVTDPRLSAGTREQVTADAQEAVGAESVQVPEDRPHPSRGDRELSSGPLLDLTNSRLLFRSIIGSALVVAMIVALTTNEWWLLPVAFIVLAAVTGSIAMLIMREIKVPEHPSPQTAAALVEDGVRSPDEYFSAVVSEFRPPQPDTGGQDRTASVEEDHHTAAAEQGPSTTPTGGPSRSVGP